MVISPELWRKIFKPMWAEFFSTLKRINPNLKILYHSDGVIDPIIPDMIEVGLDVLGANGPVPVVIRRDGPGYVAIEFDTSPTIYPQSTRSTAGGFSTMACSME